MNAGNAQIREAIAEQAAEWFIENRGGPLDHEASASFMAWLQTSPLHVEAYLRIAALAPDYGAAAKTVPTPLEALLARAHADNVYPLDTAQPGPLPAQNQRRRARTWSMAAAAVLVFVAITSIWVTRDGERFGLPRTFRSAHGELIVQSLPDGSVLHLNTDSEVTVRYGRGERLVSVDRGQALFEVVHQDPRRFRVQAGAAGVIAVGTQFDVYRQPDRVRVTVVEGTVAVYASASPGPVSGGRLAPLTVRLHEGDQVDVTDRIGAPRHVDPHAAVAWLSRQIDFEEEPLGEVAAEFNRYGRIGFVIEDDTLRALPVSGVFDAYDADSFADFLATLNGVVVERTPTQILVRRAAAGEP
jgi:transmembrane sensor